MLSSGLVMLNYKMRYGILISDVDGTLIDLTAVACEGTLKALAHFSFNGLVKDGSDEELPGLFGSCERRTAGASWRWLARLDRRLKSRLPFCHQAYEVANSRSRPVFYHCLSRACFDVAHLDSSQFFCLFSQYLPSRRILYQIQYTQNFKLIAFF